MQAIYKNSLYVHIRRISCSYVITWALLWALLVHLTWMLQHYMQYSMLGYSIYVYRSYSWWCWPLGGWSSSEWRENWSELQRSIWVCLWGQFWHIRGSHCLPPAGICWGVSCCSMLPVWTDQWWDMVGQCGLQNRRGVAGQLHPPWVGSGGLPPRTGCWSGMQWYVNDTHYINIHFLTLSLSIERLHRLCKNCFAFLTYRSSKHSLSRW